MTFLHDVARAALPVGIALLVLAALARATLAAQLQHAPALRLAREYLEPLCVWAAGTLAVSALAATAAGDAVISIVVPLVLVGVAALLLRAPEAETDEPEREEAPAPPPVPATAGPLWARRRNEGSTT